MNEISIIGLDIEKSRRQLMAHNRHAQLLRTMSVFGSIAAVRSLRVNPGDKMAIESVG